MCNWHTNLIVAFNSLDQAFIKEAQQKELQDGSTCLMALI